MEPVSATVITYNEEANIAQALESLSWASEIVVIDSGSTDQTLKICQSYTDKIFHRGWTGYVDQKNYALDKATHDWIFSLDADERTGADLANEIVSLNDAGFRYPGYKIPRVAFFMGRWIRHGDWYPDHQLRLFDRRRGRWQGGRVHESVRIHGMAGILRGEIQHFTYRTLSHYLQRLDTYSTLAAADYDQKGRRSSVLDLVASPFLTFLKGYILRLGFLDGTPGLMVAIMGAVSVYFKHAKLHELHHG